MEPWRLFSEIVILLIASLLVGGFFSRLRQSPLVGYIIAGMVLGGPGSINLVRSQQAIEYIAELGVSLLLFSVGLEFSWSRLKKMGAKTLAAGVLQVAVTMTLAAVAGVIAGFSVRESIAVGAMVSLSSTAVVLRILTERAEAESAHGRNSIGILLLQDVAVVPLAILVAMLGGGESLIGVAAGAIRILLLAVGLIIGLWIAIGKVAIYALGQLTLERNRELTMILAVVTGLGSTWAAHAAGVSPALGAFVAGVYLGSSPFATQIRADISPLRVVLLTLFFGSAGMVADPLWIMNNLPLVLGISILLMMGKMAVVWAVTQMLGQSLPVAVSTGITLSQVGEFAFVLGSIGRASGVVSDSTYLHIVSITIVTLIASPLVLPWAPSLGTRVAWLLSRSRLASLPKGDGHARVPEIVIVGFGPAGQIAGNAFLSQPDRVLVIDLNREGVKKAMSLGFGGQVGDATQIEVLEHARVQLAKAVVITVPHHHAAVRMVEQVRRLAAHAHVVVRSRYQLHASDLVAAGAHVVIGDEEEVGNSLGGHLHRWLAEQERHQTACLTTQTDAPPSA